MCQNGYGSRNLTRLDILCRTNPKSVNSLSKLCVFLLRFLIFGPRSSVPSLFRSSVFGPRSALPCRSHRAPRAAGALHRRAPADDCQSLGRSQCACRVPLASWSLACMVRLEREPVPRFPGHAVGPKWPKIRQKPGAVFIILSSLRSAQCGYLKAFWPDLFGTTRRP